MAFAHARSFLIRLNNMNNIKVDNNIRKCMATTTRSGAILPEPKTQPFGLVGVICGVALGLLIGATISKNIANFLEENDLFVPSDDDDDDD